jgi:hypothetical protein
LRLTIKDYLFASFQKQKNIDLPLFLKAKDDTFASVPMTKYNRFASVLNTKNDLFASFQKQKMIHLLQVKNKR